MTWISTAPTAEELKRTPATGTRWISRKVERWIADGKSISEISKRNLEIIVTGARFRDDEVEDSLQVCYCLAYDPVNTDLFMNGLDRFYKRFRSKV